MVGGMYDACVLALHAKAVVRGKAASSSLLDVLRFTEHIDFALARGALAAPDVPSWLDRLRKTGIDDVRAGFTMPPPKADVSARMLAGFVGGGARWCVVTLSGGRIAGSWYSQLELGNREDPQQRIWRSRFVESTDQPGSEPPQTLVGARKSLRNALADIEELARSNNAPSWADFFGSAVAVLDGGDYKTAPEFVIANDAAARLLYAAATAWCFGGMGSWNDSTVGPPQEYARCSDRLYHAINGATVAAIAAA